MNNIITLITGAGSGIGEEIAKKFYEEGHYVYLLCHKNNQKRKLEKYFDKDRATFFVGDLNNRRFIETVGRKVKYVNNLVNNAGIANKDYFLKVKSKDLDKLININFKSYFLWSTVFM